MELRRTSILYSEVQTIDLLAILYRYLELPAIQ